MLHLIPEELPWNESRQGHKPHAGRVALGVAREPFRLQPWMRGIALTSNAVLQQSLPGAVLQQSERTHCRLRAHSDAETMHREKARVRVARPV